ncbi:Blue light- and temperature-regulated antirepressor BluF [Kushneria phyllosphaerae]|uniref:Blue light- and temperature-regulated antirepressor BluF n=1 Tax=Kushneria phyllosphaerae TaxID=2100822 RepID=A0A2R8CMM8_9GAMM|nr:EAL domain-containing protein [Kushneria phyllosphaerae]SPJ34024.1 Blue light- and temperature-regulated antirepressor BluF [Kushneria phyllosphaerae]
MAFQPIVDLSTGSVFAHEALVRGINGESAWSILSQVTANELYAFDQACRVRAIEMASQLGMTSKLSINFLPNAVYEPRACIRATLKVAERVGWSLNNLIFEITENEHVADRDHLRHIVEEYHEMGFTVALDDFGTGHANLDLLTVLTPHHLKLDRVLISGIGQDVRRQHLVRHIALMAASLEIGLVAEGVETLEEASWLYRQGIMRHQGYYYARPAFEALPDIDPSCMAAVTAL